MSATNVAREGKRGNICVGNNVSATMCPRLPEPLTKRPAVSSRFRSVCEEDLVKSSRFSCVPKQLD